MAPDLTSIAAQNLEAAAHADETLTAARAVVQRLRYQPATTLEILAEALEVRQAGLMPQAKRALFIGARAERREMFSITRIEPSSKATRRIHLKPNFS